MRTASLVIRLVILTSCLLSNQYTLAQEYDCTWSDEFSIHSDGAVYMQEYINNEEGTYSVRIRYIDGESPWIGVGHNYFDMAAMAPSYIVLGRMEEDGSTSVGRYWIDGASANQILPIEDTNGHLKSASFYQQDGETILEFTHDLTIIEEGVVEQEIGADSTWIWAIGPEASDWGTRHRLQGSFSIELSDNCQALSSNLPTETMDPTGENNAAWADGEKPGDTESENAEGTATETSTTSTDTTPSSSTGANIVFNESESESEASYSLWVVHGLFMAFAWGIFAPLAIGASIFRNIGFLEKNALWFKLHIYFNLILAVLTFFGFFIAVGATKREGGQTLFQGDTHHKAGLTIFIFMIIQCFLGFFRPSAEKGCNDTRSSHASKEKSSVATTSDKSEQPASATPITSQQGSDQEEQGFEIDANKISVFDKDNEASGDGPDVSFVSDEDTWSLFTPPPPPSSPPSDGEGEELEPKDVERKKEETMSSPSSISSFDDKDPSSSKPSTIRRYWKYLHRMLGVILLALAWYNCTSGIVLFSEKYDKANEQQLLNIFWGFTGTIAVIFLLQGYVLRD